MAGKKSKKLLKKGKKLESTKALTFGQIKLIHAGNYTKSTS